MSSLNKIDLNPAIPLIAKARIWNIRGQYSLVISLIFLLLHGIYQVLTYGSESCFFTPGFTSDLDLIFHYIAGILFTFWICTEFYLWFHIKMYILATVVNKAIESNPEIFEE